MRNLLLISEGTFVKKEWDRATDIYIDYYDDFAKVFGIEIDYDDLYRMAELGVISFWINFNKGEDGNIDTQVGVLRMQIDTDIEHLEDDELVEALELIDKYKLIGMEDTRGLLITLVAKVQRLLIYECEKLY